MRNLPVRIVKGHRVNNVRVLVEGKQFLARIGVPDLARPIVASSDKFLARLVESAIRQG